MTLAIATETAPLSINRDGVVLVGGTRVTLDTVIHTFEDGVTAEEIVLRYPALHLADVYLTIGYYLRHQAEVQQYLREREAEADRVRAQYATRLDPEELRDRLLARRANQQA